VQTFEKRTSLTASQLDQAFGLVDTNKDGSIDLEEILSFTNASTSGVELGTVLDEGLSSIEKVPGKINKEASPEVFDIWNKHSMLLNAIEKWIKDMKGAIQRAKKSTEEFLKQFQSKLNGAYDENDKSEWLDTLLENIEKILMEPIEQLEAYVEKVEAILYRMKHVFAEHLHDMKMLLQNLKGLYLELNLLLGTFPSLNLNFDLVWTRVLATLFSFNIDLSKLETLVKKLLSDANALFIDIRTDIAAVLKQLEAMLKFLMNIQWKIGANMLDVGGWLMKVKIFIGFAQCYAYFPVTFDIPWPKNLLAFMKAMEFTAFDFYEVFGNVSCRMQTGFLQKYVYHMALFPAILAIILAMYVVARFFVCITRCCRCTKYTAQSLKTQVFTLISLVSFATYTGISTRVFRLYKCRKIQDSWFLTGDYTVECQQEEWNGYAASGVVFILLYVIGIPGFQLFLLYRNRHILHVRGDMSHEEKQQQHIVEKEYGSIYANYTPECYYYDILDLFRRLLLTGGLIMMGEESIAQVFLGIVICAMWLSLLIHKKPYKVVWDNIIAIIMAAHLLLTMVAGMSLKLYAATPGQNEYQKAGFGVVLITVSVLCIVLGLGSIIISTPCLRKTFMTCLRKRQRRNDKLSPVTSEKVVVEKQNADKDSESDDDSSTKVQKSPVTSEKENVVKIVVEKQNTDKDSESDDDSSAKIQKRAEI
jgi:hypothetical protein